MLRRFIASIIIIAFLTTGVFPPSRSYAQSVVSLPEPGTMVSLSQSFEPVLIKGLTVHKDNPFMFDFVVDTGNSKLSTQDAELRTQADRLIKYFFACLTIPEKDLWVNLSPYEKDRMAPEALGQTALGRDLLSEDYILKQLTASLIYPEKDLGREFWDKVFTKAQQKYGTTNIPVNTFNKVWILADKATVYEHGQTAFVVDGHLKVLLEEDYLAMSKHSSTVMPVKTGIQNMDISLLPVGRQVRGNDKESVNTIGSQIVRDIVIPELEKEVNSGKNFSTLRQIFNSLILASWYKKNLKEALLNQIYADKNTVKGVDLSDPSVKEQIYQQYLKAYKKGVFNYIKEDAQVNGPAIPRKYFSGGFDVSPAMLSVVHFAPRNLESGGSLVNFKVMTGLNGNGVQNDLELTKKETANSQDLFKVKKTLERLYKEIITLGEDLKNQDPDYYYNSTTRLMAEAQSIYDQRSSIDSVVSLTARNKQLQEIADELDKRWQEIQEQERRNVERDPKANTVNRIKSSNIDLDAAKNDSSAAMLTTINKLLGSTPQLGMTPQELAGEIESTLRNPNSGNIPSIFIISDEHGTIDKFDFLLLDMFRSVPAGQKIPANFVLDPNKTIDEQFNQFEIKLSDFRKQLFIHNLGDFVDRGPFGIKVLLRSKELIEANISDFIIGNHDQWMFMNLIGMHLPFYDGFEFYGYKDSYGAQKGGGDVRFLLQQLHKDKPDTRKLSWWAKELYEFREFHQTQQKNRWNKSVKEVENMFETIVNGMSEDGKKRWSRTTASGRVWNKLRGFNPDVGDVSTGVKAVGLVSIVWWENLLKEFEVIYDHLYVERKIELDSAKQEAWLSAINLIKNHIIPGLKKTLEEHIDPDKGGTQPWWRIFEAINSQNYTSPEWWAMDWAYHNGWGTSVFKEINDTYHGGEQVVTPANYLDDNSTLQGVRILKEATQFFKQKYNLHLRDIMQTDMLHAFLPIDPDTGEFYFNYRAKHYRGKGGERASPFWEGLDAIAKDIRDAPDNETLIKVIQEAITIVNGWYADNTTEAKVSHVARALRDVGLKKVLDANGLNRFITGHLPMHDFLKLTEDERRVITGHLIVTENGRQVIAFSDSGAGPKFGGGAKFLVTDKNGFRLRGLPGKNSKIVVDSPSTVIYKRAKGPTTQEELRTVFLNDTSIPPDVFLRTVLENINENAAMTTKEIHVSGVDVYSLEVPQTEKHYSEVLFPDGKKWTLKGTMARGDSVRVEEPEGNFKTTLFPGSEPLVIKDSLDVPLVKVFWFNGLSFNSLTGHSLDFRVRSFYDAAMNVSNRSDEIDQVRTALVNLFFARNASVLTSSVETAEELKKNIRLAREKLSQNELWAKTKAVRLLQERIASLESNPNGMLGFTPEFIDQQIQAIQKPSITVSPISAAMTAEDVKQFVDRFNELVESHSYGHKIKAEFNLNLKGAPQEGFIDRGRGSIFTIWPNVDTLVLAEYIRKSMNMQGFREEDIEAITARLKFPTLALTDNNMEIPFGHYRDIKADDGTPLRVEHNVNEKQAFVSIKTVKGGWYWHHEFKENHPDNQVGVFGSIFWMFDGKEKTFSLFWCKEHPKNVVVPEHVTNELRKTNPSIYTVLGITEAPARSIIVENFRIVSAADTVEIKNKFFHPMTINIKDFFEFLTRNNASKTTKKITFTEGSSLGDLNLPVRAQTYIFLHEIKTIKQFLEIFPTEQSLYQFVNHNFGKVTKKQIIEEFKRVGFPLKPDAAMTAEIKSQTTINFVNGQITHTYPREIGVSIGGKTAILVLESTTDIENRLMQVFQTHIPSSLSVNYIVKGGAGEKIPVVLKLNLRSSLMEEKVDYGWGAELDSQSQNALAQVSASAAMTTQFIPGQLLTQANIAEVGEEIYHTSFPVVYKSTQRLDLQLVTRTGSRTLKIDIYNGPDGKNFIGSREFYLTGRNEGEIREKAIEKANLSKTMTQKTWTWLGQRHRYNQGIEDIVQEAIKDSAMNVNEVGGIDLNSANMGMIIQKDANGGVQVTFDPALIERIKIQGIQSVEPIIINITPIADVRPLLGLGSELAGVA